MANHLPLPFEEAEKGGSCFTFWFEGTAAFLGICLILNKITSSQQQNKLKNKVPSGYVDCAFSPINLCLPKCDQRRCILVLSWDLWW